MATIQEAKNEAYRIVNLRRRVTADEMAMNWPASLHIFEPKRILDLLMAEGSVCFNGTEYLDNYKPASDPS